MVVRFGCAMLGREMALRLVALCVDANDPLGLARFWAEALRWEVADETGDEVSLVPTDGTRFRLDFVPVPEPKVGPNRIHLDLTTTSLDDQQEIGGEARRARRPPHRHRAATRRRAMSCWLIPRATSSA